MSKPAFTQDYDWHVHWQRYDDASSQNPAQRMRHQIVARLLTEDAGDRPVRLFDIGSGQGDMMSKLIPLFPNSEFLGVELSESGVEASRRKAPVATFLAADLFAPPTSLEPYRGWASHAACSEVLEHVDDPVAFLTQARPYLAPGAALVVTVPGGPMSAFDRYIGHRQHFTRASIRDVLEKSGFEVQQVYLAGFPFFNLYRLAVIARGEKLAVDVQAGEHGSASRLASLTMAVFRFLFRGNLLDSPFGWQVVAVARKASA